MAAETYKQCNDNADFCYIFKKNEIIFGAFYIKRLFVIFVGMVKTLVCTKEQSINIL